MKFQDIKAKLEEGKRGPKPGQSEGRPEKWFIGYEARDGFNIYCEKGDKHTFRSIEKMKSDDVAEYGYQALKPAAEKKLKELQKRDPENDDLELRSEFKLAQWL